MRYVILVFLVSAGLNGATNRLEKIITALEKNKGKVEDMECTVVIRTGLPGEKEMVQKFRMWTKGDKKIRIEPFGDYRGEMSKMIVNGDRMLMVGPDGKEFITDYNKNKSALPGGTKMEQNYAEFLKEKDVKRIEIKGNKAVVEVVPENYPVAQKVVMVVDLDKGVVTEQKLYTNFGVNKMRMHYQRIDNAWVMSDIEMDVPVPQGGRGKMVIEFKNVKVNKGIKDNLFYIPEK